MRRTVRALTASVVSLSVVLVACGGAATTSRTHAPQHRPAPSTADVAQLRTMATEVPIDCSYVEVNGDAGTLGRLVDALMAMYGRTDPKAPITIAAGAGTTTLHDFAQSIAHKLNATNAFGTPTCAPHLGQRLVRALGITTP